jgi:hypothetical protein
VLHEGKILDGRHRYLACLAKQEPPRFCEYAGQCDSALAFVISKNIRRRHLTESQRAFVAAGLKPLFEEEARQREHAHLKQGTQPCGWPSRRGCARTLWVNGPAVASAEDTAGYLAGCRNTRPDSADRPR